MKISKSLLKEMCIVAGTSVLLLSCDTGSQQTVTQKSFSINEEQNLTLVSPVDKFIASEKSIEFLWESAKDSEMYQIVIYNDIEVFLSHETKETKFNFEIPEYCSYDRIWWCVRYKANGTWSEWSKTRIIDISNFCNLISEEVEEVFNCPGCGRG